MTLSDNPLMPSGVATQTKYMIEQMLKTGKYQFFSIGGAIKNQNHNPVAVNEDWVIQPVDGYGNANMVRALMAREKPDIVWFMTDPRYWTWLWQIENEIRANAPLVYYHVWDNGPTPSFNKKWYESCDAIGTISKVTDNIVRETAPNVNTKYIPHTVNTDIFTPMTDGEIQAFKDENLLENKDKFIVFWNNRNARRKHAGTVIWWFNEFLKRIGKENAMLVMHTEPKDPAGQDLEAIGAELGLTKDNLIFSRAKISAEDLTKLFNVADCTINVADAEGFGLGTLESLACGTPIIVNMTGGLQEQVTDGVNEFGVGIEPSSKYVIGSQEVPFIYEDRVSEEDVVNALIKLYEMSKEDRKEMGRLGRQHVLDNYGFDTYQKNWDEFLTSIHEKHSSWPNKSYKRWGLVEVGGRK